MALVNEHFLKLPDNYLFSDIAKKVNSFKVVHPRARIISLGIGDVTRPLPQASIEAMHRAVDELANAKTFRGYGPEQGYDFLIDAIIKHNYTSRGIQLTPAEVFISDGSKVIVETSETSCVMITVLELPIPFIRCTLTVMSCVDEPEHWKTDDGVTLPTFLA